MRTSYRCGRGYVSYSIETCVKTRVQKCFLGDSFWYENNKMLNVRGYPHFFTNILFMGVSSFYEIEKLILTVIHNLLTVLILCK
jgi:hypothetical protein